jgi:alpha-L-fucosidase
MEYEPRRGSVSHHQVPEWYHDAKLGIFIHWSLSCIPAFAPRRMGDIIEILEKTGPEVLFANSPYAEWYLNGIRIKDSPFYEHHRATYGEGFDYYRFIEEFNAGLRDWDPNGWRDLFKSAGARYVVLVTKHHDGFLLWPSENPNPVMPACHASRDVVGELTASVKAGGMRMGFYYSSPLDWTFTTDPITDFADLLSSGPTDRRYIDYVGAHWHELIDRYEPSILWSDIGYPPGDNVNALFSYFYNRNPDGVVNDRWAQASAFSRWLMRSAVGRPLVNRIGRRMFVGGKTTPPVLTHCDYTTPEYATFSDIREKKWECVRGMGRSFGYNREETPADIISLRELVRLLIDIVSKNGNLLLNVGPMPGGTIPDVQVERLKGLGAWLDVNGDAIFGTRPWLQAEGRALDGTQVRFTRKHDDAFALLMDTPAGRTVTLESLQADPGTTIHLLGREHSLTWRNVGNDLEVELGDPLPDRPAHALRIAPAPMPAIYGSAESKVLHVSTRTGSVTGKG